MPLPDSLQNANIERLQNQVDSLSIELLKVNTSTNYFHEILNSQRTLLHEQTGLFSLIVLGLLSIAALISWATFFRSYSREVTEVKSSLRDVKELKDKQNQILLDLGDARINIFRSLYEAQQIDNKWKTIFNIRYSYALLKYNQGEGLKKRAKELERDYKKLDPKTHFKEFLKFSNREGLLNMLNELMHKGPEEMQKIASRIFIDLKQGTFDQPSEY